MAVAKARTKGGKTLCEEKIKGSLPLFLDKRDTTHVQKGSLWVKGQGILPGHNESCSSQKPSLQDPSWLRGVCTPRGGSQGRSGVEKETR